MLYWSIDPSNTTPPLDKLYFYNEISNIYKTQDDSPKILAEICAQYKSTPSEPKPKKENGGRNNKNFNKDGSYWLSGSFTLDTIRQLVSSGFIFRYGVKNFGTKYKENFVSQQIFFLDIDSDQSISESIEQFSDTAFLIYRTPSYTEENQKHRILFCLPEPIYDWKQSSTIYQILLNTYQKADKSCKDPSRVCYPTIDPINGFEFFNPNNRLTVDFDSEEFRSIYAILSSPQQTNTANGSRFHLPLIKSLETDFEWDLNAFLLSIGLTFDFDFKEISADFDGKKWQGFNPFSRTNASGTSLVASVKDGKIIFYDRSSSENDGATIYGLIDSVENKYSCLVDALDYEDFQKLVYRVFGDLKIKLLDYASDCHYIDEKGKPKLKDIITILNDFVYPELKGFLYHYPNIFDNSLNGDIYYIYSSKGWYQSQSKDSLRSIIIDKFQEIFRMDMPSKLINSLNDKVLIAIPEYLRLESRPIPNVNYQFFANGYYDLEKKTLNPYSNKIWYFRDEVLPYPYKPSTGEAIELLQQGFNQSALIEEDQQILKTSLILIAQNQFFKTQKFLYLYGITTSGKSAFSSIIAKMFNCMIHSADTVNKSGEDYIGTYIKKVTVLDEVVSVTKIMSTIMTTVRNTNDQGVTFRYRNLHEKHYQKTIPFSLILNGEVLTLGKTNTGQQGQSKRIIPVEFLTQLDPNNNAYKTILSTPSLLHDLFCWAVEQDYSQNQSRIDWLMNLSETPDSIQSERLGGLLTTSDPFFDFLNHFDADPNFDGETFANAYSFDSSQLLDWYRTSTGDFESYKFSSDRARLAQKFTRSIREKFPKFREKRVGKAKVTNYYGVVFSNDQNNNSVL